MQRELRAHSERGAAEADVRERPAAIIRLGTSERWNSSMVIGPRYCHVRWPAAALGSAPASAAVKETRLMGRAGHWRRRARRRNRLR
jgi:hypothetical protein